MLSVGSLPHKDYCMPILDLIEFIDNSGEIIVTREPQEGSGEFRLGSQLIVQENQVAVFFKDGRALDTFRAGRHKLATENLPLLGSVIGIPFGRSPFRSYVYFVATKTFPNLGWGTPTPVLFRDADFRMVTLRAHGIYSIRIQQPHLFIQTLVGTKGVETTFGLEDFLRSIIVSRLNEVLGGSMKSILDLSTLYTKIAQSTKDAVREDFQQYGIQLVDLLINAITVPPEVQEMINRATGIAAQDADKYRAIAASDAMRDAARNPGAAGMAAGAGVGIGIGLGLSQQMANALQPTGSATPTSPPSRGEAPASKINVEELKIKLQNLQGLRNEGLISDSDFEEQKRRLLAQL